MEVAYPITQNILDGGVQAILGGYDRMDSIQKALLLSIMNSSKQLRSIQIDAVEEEDRLVFMILLIRLLEETDSLLILESPLLAKSLESNDPSVESLANWVKRRAENLLEMELSRDTESSG